MITRERKQEIINGLKQKFSDSNAFFLTNLIGVTANDTTAIRKNVREAGGEILVTRNTLFKRAVEGTEFSELFDNLKGPHAVAFSFDEAPGVAKAVYNASESFEVIDFKGGFLGTKALSSADVVQLAKLPSRDEMLGTLLATFNAPISALARVLFQVGEQKAEGAPVVEEVKADATPSAEETAEAKTEESKTEENKE